MIMGSICYIALLGRIDQLQIQTILAWLFAVGFISTVLAVGVIWVVKRSPSATSLFMYGMSFLLLSLPIFGLVKEPKQEDTLIRAVAVPWNITAVRSRADTSSVSIAPFGEIKKGEILLQASSPEIDARLRVLESRAQQLELDKRMVQAGVSKTNQFSIANQVVPMKQEKQLLLQYSADLRSLERQKLPLLREISSFEIDFRNASDEVENFRELLSNGFATRAEVTIKENILAKLASNKSSYDAQLKSIEDQISSIEVMVSALDEMVDTSSPTAETVAAAREGEENALNELRKEKELTQVAQLDLQLDAIKLEIDSINNTLIHVAPHDGVVLWKHPSPRSAVPGTPLVAMSKAGESGVLLKIIGNDVNDLSIDNDSEISIDVIHSDYQLKGSNFEAKCVVYRSGIESQDASRCELLLTSHPPATLFQDLMKSDFVPLELVLRENGNADEFNMGFLSKITFGVLNQ